MLIAVCPLCGEVIQEGDKAVMFEDVLGKIKQLAHEDCYTGWYDAGRMQDDKQAFFDSSRGVGI